jgi:hypothetical protein
MIYGYEKYSILFYSIHNHFIRKQNSGKQHVQYVRFAILATVSIKITLHDVTPCSLVDGYQRF